MYGGVPVMPARNMPLLSHRYASGGLVLLLLLAACAGSRTTERPAQLRFEHRPEGPEPDGRVVMTLEAPDPSVDYFYYDVIYDSVYARPAEFATDRPADVQQVPVEVLVKGALPDGCTELHEVTQERIGNIIEVELSLRRPRGAVCSSVLLPYRFYFMLEGTYAPGSYTLKLNDRVWPFTVEPRDA